jgi:hypothetical protein
MNRTLNQLGEDIAARLALVVNYGILLAGLPDAQAHREFYNTFSEWDDTERAVLWRSFNLTRYPDMPARNWREELADALIVRL